MNALGMRRKLRLPLVVLRRPPWTIQPLPLSPVKWVLKIYYLSLSPPLLFRSTYNYTAATTITPPPILPPPHLRSHHLHHHHIHAYDFNTYHQPHTYHHAYTHQHVHTNTPSAPTKYLPSYTSPLNPIVSPPLYPVVPPHLYIAPTPQP